MRDDFPSHVKEVLAKRVGYLCSNPNCRQPTAGPLDDPTKAVNIGVAAHITAASPGGPRFDDTLTSKQRASHENGVWLSSSSASANITGEINVWPPKWFAKNVRQVVTESSGDRADKVAENWLNPVDGN